MRKPVAFILAGIVRLLLWALRPVLSEASRWEATHLLAEYEEKRARGEL